VGSLAVAAVLGAIAAGSIVLIITAIRSRRRSRRIRACVELAQELSGSGVDEVVSKGGSRKLAALEAALAFAARKTKGDINELRIEAARTDAILSSVGEGVLAVDNDLRVIFCNDALARVVGARQPVKGRPPLLEIVRDSELHALVDDVIRTGEQVKRSLKIGAARGRSFEVHGAPFDNATGRGAIAILHDITDLERLEQVRKDFIANVSHEMRTPLTSIIACADTLLDGALNDAAGNRRFVEMIKANAGRLNSISSDLLTLSDLESGVIPGQPERISIREVLETAMRTVEAEAATVDVKLETGVVEDVFVIGYKFRLEQALTNLLANAVKFNRRGGEVRASAIREDNRVRVAIADTGIGIPSQELSRIFERFYRVDKARSRQVGGTGLGLSIVKHVTEAMGGSIEVSSQLGKGSTFTITLPAEVAHALP
jgi:two-component system phosphate regulon sensor histidine kinase PhoR